MSRERKREYRKVLGKKFRIHSRTTTKRGRKEYMQKYMEVYRRRRSTPLHKRRQESKQKRRR